MAEHNQLVGQGENHKDPYKAKGADFKVNKVGRAGNKQSGGPQGEAEGQDQLVEQSWNQLSPRDLESASPQGPSEWGKGGKAFSVGVNSEGGQSVDEGSSVDLMSGKISVRGYKATKVGETPDPKVSIG